MRKLIHIIFFIVVFYIQVFRHRQFCNIYDIIFIRYASKTIICKLKAHPNVILTNRKIHDKLGYIGFIEM